MLSFSRSTLLLLTLVCVSFVNSQIIIHKGQDLSSCEAELKGWSSPSVGDYKAWLAKKGNLATKSFDSMLQGYETFVSNAKLFTCSGLHLLGISRDMSSELELLTSLRVTVGSTTYSFYDSIFADKPPNIAAARFMPSTPASAAPRRGVEYKPLYAEPAPDSFDWRDRNRVTPVKDQGNYGTCWAFSTMGMLEGALGPAGYSMVDLSVEALVECDNQVDPLSNNADCSMFGGWPNLALQHLQNFGGVRTWDDFSYAYKDGEFVTIPCMPDGYDKKRCGNHDDKYCKRNSTQGQGPEQLCDSKRGRFYAQVLNWTDIATDEDVIKQALFETGPLSVALNADGILYYKEGIYDPAECSTHMNHAVLIVGYGVENSIPFWTVKNSWNTNFGEDGYFRIRRGKNTCGINQQVLTAKVVPKGL